MNVALVAPAGTVTFEGTVAGLAPDNCTTAPLAGAGPLSVTVPVDDEPAATVDGLSVSDVTPTVTPGLMVMPVLAVELPNAAVIVAGVVVVTGNAPKEKSPELDPADTRTVGGRLTAGLFAESDTRTCPAGAGAVKTGSVGASSFWRSEEDSAIGCAARPTPSARTEAPTSARTVDMCAS